LAPDLILYGTSACHLCDEALTVLEPIINPSGMTMLQVDIADDNDLMSRYGLRIPVLSYKGHDLSWPFNPDQVVSFLSRHKD
jgi:hypothetical protein